MATLEKVRYNPRKFSIHPGDLFYYVGLTRVSMAIDPDMDSSKMNQVLVTLTYPIMYISTNEFGASAAPTYYGKRWNFFIGSNGKVGWGLDYWFMESLQNNMLVKYE